jgi:hypothetical protein
MPSAHPGQPPLIQDNNNAPPIVSQPRTHAQLRNQAEAHLINMLIQDKHMLDCSLAIKPHKIHHGYLQATQALLVWMSWALTHLASLVPSSMTT